MRGHGGGRPPAANHFPLDALTFMMVYLQLLGSIHSLAPWSSESANGLVSAVLSVSSAVSGRDFTMASVEVCVVPGLTAVGKQLLLLGRVASLYVCVPLAVALTKPCRRRQPRSAGTLGPAPASPGLQAHHGGSTLRLALLGDSPAGDAPAVDTGAVWDRPQAPPGPAVPMLGWVAGLMTLCRMFFFVLVSTCATLLHCVALPDRPPGDRFLFIDARVQCHWGAGWQTAVRVALYGVLVPTPLVALVLASLARRRTADDHRHARAWAAVHRVLSGAYRDGAWYFDAVLLLFVLTVALLTSGVATTSPVSAAMTLGILSAVMAAVLAVVQPARSRAAGVAHAVSVAALLLAAPLALIGVMLAEVQPTARQLAVVSGAVGPWQHACVAASHVLVAAVWLWARWASRRRQ